MGKASKPTDKARKIVDEMASECLALRIRILNRSLSSLYEESLRSVNLKVSQMNLLVAIAKNGPLRAADLAPRLAMEKSTFSRNVERLVERGLVQSSPGEDQRTHWLRITSTGLSMIQDIAPSWRKAQNTIGQALGKSQVKALHDMAQTALHITTA